ncbi:DUF3592 domain-containing protein [Gilvimarinus sp. 1_MG-2023]|uniref:DUF3592 domain-containing protein n=1 Tax=Gilvimarinus sp. 1_MG-2023 TaxID=3062638 RepID=UPI0026E32993|nr:DUF3592 domain-containing protein [Gilvimarinus sp. 1_MG-2023]MDO6747871.1 DUF3592 domain-containing protein [Gilvimarinus sp. 1_MG-2023]
MAKEKSSLTAKLKERWLMILFGLPFAAVGVGMFFWGVAGTLVDKWAVESWQPVSAQLTQIDLKRGTSDGSITYKVTASYQYSFNGQPFMASRVGLTDGFDNVGDYHQRESSRLQRALNQGQSVQAWVDPDQPSQAILNRDVRWGMIGFSMIFVIVFGGVGGGIIVYCLCAPTDKMPNQGRELGDRPWLERRDWAHKEIKSNGKTSLYVSWGVAIAWNAIAIPAGIGGVNAALKGELIALIALLFPAVGLGLIGWAVSVTLSWRRFGPAPLQLDPYPGAVGGQVGGSIEVRLPYSINHRFDVSLQCLRSYMSGSGKNRSRRESLVWQTEGVAQTQASATGTRLEILFDVDSDLPVSQTPSRSYHLWRLVVDCELPGADFSRQYEIPVFATGQKAAALSRLSTENILAQQSREEALESVLNVEQIPGGIILHYPAWRHPGGKMALILVGAIFAGVGFLIPADDFPSWIFTLIGIPMLLAGIYYLMCSLDVRIDQSELVTRRRLLGVSLGNRHYPRSSIQSLALKESYTSQSGKSHTTFYKIIAKRHTGKPVTVGFNLAGRDVAKQALESLSLLTGVAIDEN